MNGKSSESNHEKNKHVFQQLDKCISEARKAEQTNNWKYAWQEADKLIILTKCSCILQIVTNFAAALSDVYQQDWISVMVSVAAIFGLVVVLCGNKRKK